MKNPFRRKSLDGQIWAALYNFPMLYQDGGQVLHHMYCVIGNGYEWENGRLAHKYDDTDHRDDVYDTYRIKSTLKMLRVQFEVDRLRRNHLIDFVRANIKLLVKDVHREWQSLYPICEYSRLTCVPDDVRPDFLAGARLAINLSYGALFKGGGLVSFYVTTRNQRRRHDATQASIETLDAALASIIERFGPDPLGVKSNNYLLWRNFAEYVKFEKLHDRDMRRMLSGMLAESRAR